MNRVFLFLFIVLTVLSGCGDTVSYSSSADSPAADYSGESETEYVEKENAGIYVSVLGEVLHPGVYIVPQGYRMFEALNAAGGVTDNADISGINLVEFVEDGMQINIPSKNSYVNTNNAVITTNHEGKVNINTAGVEELKTISGIGDTRAMAIIEYRNNNGRFNKIEDIMLVAGIKETTFEKIKDEIYVD